MQTSKVCSICGASIGADQDSMRDAMEQHRESHVQFWKKEIEELEKKISDAEETTEE